MDNIDQTPVPKSTSTPESSTPVSKQTPPQPLPNQRPPFSAGQIALLALFLLIILFAGGLYFLNRKAGDNGSKPPATNGTPTSTTNTTGTNPTPTSTSTDSNTTSTPSTPAPTEAIHTVGETVVMLKGDSLDFKPKNKSDATRWNVTAVDFADSRCAPDVQCVWAGERSVGLHIIQKTADGKEQSQNINLGTVNNNSVRTLGLTLTLKEIDDGKGGVYAEIEVK